MRVGMLNSLCTGGLVTIMQTYGVFPHLIGCSLHFLVTVFYTIRGKSARFFYVVKNGVTDNAEKEAIHLYDGQSLIHYSY